MAEWYGITLTKTTAQDFKEFLRQGPMILNFEPSECYSKVHIEFKTELQFDEVINKFMAWSLQEEV